MLYFLLLSISDSIGPTRKLHSIFTAFKFSFAKVRAGFDRSISVYELTEIEETFRNPNLLFESIQEMQQKQEEALKDIQIKLNEMKSNQTVEGTLLSLFASSPFHCRSPPPHRG